MNKEEIGHILHGAKLALTRLENRTEQSLKAIRANIKTLEHQLADAEPLKEFEIGDLRFRLKETVVDVEDTSDDTYFYFPRKALPEIILNLRKMQLQLEGKGG